MNHCQSVSEEIDKWEKASARWDKTGELSLHCCAMFSRKWTTSKLKRFMNASMKAPANNLKCWRFQSLQEKKQKLKSSLTDLRNFFENPMAIAQTFVEFCKSFLTKFRRKNLTNMARLPKWILKSFFDDRKKMRSPWEILRGVSRLHSTNAGSDDSRSIKL